MIGKAGLLVSRKASTGKAAPTVHRNAGGNYLSVSTWYSNRYLEYY